VLAELAGQVAARGAERQNRGTRQEMVKRFLLDRIDAEAARTAIGGEHDLAALRGADEAQAALPVMQPAGARADIALNPPVIEPGPMPRRHDRFFGSEPDYIDHRMTPPCGLGTHG